MFVVSVFVHRNGEQLHHNKQSATISQSLFSFLTPPNILLLACLRSFISIAKTNCIFCSHFICMAVYFLWSAWKQFNMIRFGKFIETFHLAWFVQLKLYTLCSALCLYLFSCIWLPSLIHEFACIILLSVEKCFHLKCHLSSHFCWSIVCSQHRECQYFVFFSTQFRSLFALYFCFKKDECYAVSFFPPSSVCSSFALRHCSFWMHLIAAKDV